jgi:hypothetical protein
MALLLHTAASKQQLATRSRLRRMSCTVPQEMRCRDWPWPDACLQVQPSRRCVHRIVTLSVMVPVLQQQLASLGICCF